MTKRIIHSLVGLTVLAVAAGVLIGSASARGERQTATAATTIQVKGGEFFFRLSSKSIPRPGRVTFVFKNIGHVQHDFKISGKKTSLIGPGKTARLIVVFKAKKKYPYLCTVPGHAAAGMKGVFTVR